MKLVVLEGPAAHPAFEILAERTLIGRAPDCDVLVFDAQVSRHHAQIVRTRDAYVLESLQPANPAIVNDQIMLTRRQLIDGDLIVLGSVVLMVDLPPPTEVERGRAAAAEATTDQASVRTAPPSHGTQPSPAHQPPPRTDQRPTLTDWSVDLRESATPAPDARPTPSPVAPGTGRTPAPQERWTPRPATVPQLSPREQLRAVAARLGAAGQRLQTRLAAQASLPVVPSSESEAVTQITDEHERLGGDAELARLASLLSERLSNQTDIRALYRLGAEAAGLVAWSRLAQRSMEDAVHLADVLGVHRVV